MSTSTLAAPVFLGDTYGGSNFFSPSVNSVSTGGGGRTRSDLRTLGIFDGGLEEARRSTLDGDLATKTCTLASCTGGWLQVPASTGLLLLEVIAALGVPLV